VSFSQTVDNFQQFIDANNLTETLDVDVCKGFIIALAVINCDLPFTDIVANLFDDEQIYYQHPEQKQINDYLADLKDKALSCLIAENVDELLNDEVSEDFCIGFVAGIYCIFADLNDELKTEVAELLSPIAFVANLYDEDSDLAQIAKNAEETEILLAEIPNSIIDLFLLFNADES